MLVFVRERRTLDALVVVKLAIFSTVKKVTQAYECSLPESNARASFPYFFFLGGRLLLSFHGFNIAN